MNEPSDQIQDQKVRSAPQIRWDGSVFTNPNRLAEMIATRSTHWPTLGVMLLSWWFHDPQTMTRLSIRTLDSHIFAVPALIQAWFFHALPILGMAAAVAVCAHYAARRRGLLSIPLEDRWFATSALWLWALVGIALTRVLGRLIGLEIDPFSSSDAELSQNPLAQGLSFITYGVSLGVIVVSALRLGHQTHNTKGLMAAPSWFTVTSLSIGVIASGLVVANEWDTIQPLRTESSAPEFNLQNAQTSARVTSSEWFKNNSVTVIDFWATWCEPCKIAMPEIEELYRDYKSDGLKVLSVNIEADSPDVVRRYLQERPIPFDVWLDDDRMAFRYGIRLYPTFILVKGANIVGIYEGLPGLIGLKQSVAQLLGDKP